MCKKTIASLILIPFLSTPLLAKWNTYTKKDEMTGEKSAYAVLDNVKSTKPMSFPYSDIESFVAIGCDQTSQWVYLGFSKTPNITNAEPNNGYSTITSRIKFDDKVEETYFKQDFGSRFVHFNLNNIIIDKIKKANTMLIEFKWYGDGEVYFKYPLKGSSKAIEKIHKHCKK